MLIDIAMPQAPRALPVAPEAARSGETRAAREPGRIAATAPSDLQYPFNPSRDQAAVTRLQLELAAEDRARDTSQAENGPAKPTDIAELSDEEQAVVDELSARDREVRNHEEAHARVGGPYAGAPSYTYQTGPDGKRYAIGGEVAIDVAPVADDPEATITKMEVVKAAALAPAEPSGQDRKVAAIADATRQQAIADLAELRRQTEPLSKPQMDRAA